MVDLKLLEQKRTSAVVCSEIKPRVRKDQKKKKKPQIQKKTQFKRGISGHKDTAGRREHPDADGLQLIWEVL